ncbi:hypothetical protein BK132_00160 [Paenibacillus sp. FSL H8-0259]|nr:hypothetical protein BK132_00160 [Paenibacillus sp. FSL H8-0259]
MNRELRVVRRSHRRPANLARERNGGKSFKYAVTEVPVTGLFVSPGLPLREQGDMKRSWTQLGLPEWN